LLHLANGGIELCKRIQTWTWALPPSVIGTPNGDRKTAAKTEMFFSSGSQRQPQYEAWQDMRCTFLSETLHRAIPYLEWLPTPHAVVSWQTPVKHQATT